MERNSNFLSAKCLIPVWLSVPLYIIITYSLVAVLSIFSSLFLKLLPANHSTLSLLITYFVSWLVMLFSAVVCAILFMKYINGRPVSELGFSIKGRRKDCLVGVIFAAVLYAIGFTVSLALGVLEVAAVRWDFVSLIGSFIVYFIAASAEEVLVRGYVQGILMTKMNKFAALIVASLLFSLLHIFNANLTFFSLLNLFLAGIMLGASFMYTHNLWFPIMLHTAWNWIQGSVLGYEVSGGKLFPSLFTLRLSENNLLNGGSFGFEGSIICSILLIISSVLIVRYYESR
ncbi:CPBP family intramembrane glutamic endopeptidase [Bacteroides sp. 224]|uniref:CPBP family intramembrane glutamic endopeptidase n=1 Tax=Bacteroides sp. 224 TaxID=2302936 RepID=UPI0013D77D5F|nr:type II CAAX endopeptidase family protein [Bacteroides sp. 224]NDV65994.1 CPBP family intramembrane metalloprotease [Bacteroides sp. 224]